MHVKTVLPPPLPRQTRSHSSGWHVTIRMTSENNKPASLCEASYCRMAQCEMAVQDLPGMNRCLRGLGRALMPAQQGCLPGFHPLCSAHGMPAPG